MAPRHSEAVNSTAVLFRLLQKHQILTVGNIFVLKAGYGDDFTGELRAHFFIFVDAAIFVPDGNNFIADAPKDFSELKHASVADNQINVQLEVTNHIRSVEFSNEVGVFASITFPVSAGAFLKGMCAAVNHHKLRFVANKFSAHKAIFRAEVVV